MNYDMNYKIVRCKRCGYLALKISDDESIYNGIILPHISREKSTICINNTGVFEPGIGEEVSYGITVGYAMIRHITDNYPYALSAITLVDFITDLASGHVDYNSSVVQLLYEKGDELRVGQVIIPHFLAHPHLIIKKRYDDFGNEIYVIQELDNQGNYQIGNAIREFCLPTEKPCNVPIIYRKDIELIGEMKQDSDGNFSWPPDFEKATLELYL